METPAVTHEQERQTLTEWGEDHGYAYYRCPHCGNGFYSDCGPIGNCGCPGDLKDYEFRMEREKAQGGGEDE